MESKIWLFLWIGNALVIIGLCLFLSRRDLVNFLKFSIKILKEVWKIKHAPIIHYHLFGGFAEWQYKIAFDELHKAHLKYNHRIRSTQIAKNRVRNKDGKFQ